MPQYFYFIIIFLLQLMIVWRFYRREKYFAVLTGFFVNLFALSIVALIGTSFELNIIILGAILILICGAGYGIFFEDGFKKAFVVSLVTNGAGFAVACLLIKIIH
jgi:hypothetical protein